MFKVTYSDNRVFDGAKWSTFEEMRNFFLARKGEAPINDYLKVQIQMGAGVYNYRFCSRSADILTDMRVRLAEDKIRKVYGFMGMDPTQMLKQGKYLLDLIPENC